MEYIVIRTSDATHSRVDPRLEGHVQQKLCSLLFFFTKAMIDDVRAQSILRCHFENDFLLNRPNNDLDVMPIMSDSGLEVGSRYKL